VRARAADADALRRQGAGEVLALDGRFKDAVLRRLLVSIGVAGAGCVEVFAVGGRIH
jgi:hypothetical protein